MFILCNNVYPLISMSSIEYLVPDILVRRNGHLEYSIYDRSHLCACVFLHIHVAEKSEREQYFSMFYF